MLSFKTSTLSVTSLYGQCLSTVLTPQKCPQPDAIIETASLSLVENLARFEGLLLLLLLDIFVSHKGT